MKFFAFVVGIFLLCLGVACTVAYGTNYHVQCYSNGEIILNEGFSRCQWTGDVAYCTDKDGNDVAINAPCFFREFKE